MDAPRRPPVVLIYAGGSVFGQLLASELLAQTDAQLILAGPRGTPEARAARVLDPTGARVRSARASLEDAARLSELLDGATAAVCCVRGFRGVPATLVDACLAGGVAYFDIADSREYVERVLDRRAAIAAREIVVGTGLGLLPGLSALMSAAAIAQLELYEIARIDTALFMGSHQARGVGALAAALRSAGRPLARNLYGWSGRQRITFPAPLAKRNVYTFDAPDYDLFPRLFGVRPDRLRVRMGFELEVVNRVLWLLGWLRRLGWRWRYRGPLITTLLGLSAPLRAVGEDRCALLVTVRGIAHRPGHHGAIRVGTLTVLARDARLLMVLPCAVAVTRYLAGDLAPGLLDWRGWIAPEALWEILRARGMRVDWRLE